MSRRRDRKQANQVVKAQLAAERRRSRALWTSVVVAVVLVIAVGVTAAIVATNRHSRAASEYAIPANTTRNAPGLTIGTGNTTVDVYFDFLCQDCNEFQTLGGSVLSGMVGSQQIRVVYHPLNVLDTRSDGSHFSTRAAAAAGCASDAGKLPDFISAMYANQPKENTRGPSNAQIAAIGTKVGITGAAFTKCVTSQKYAGWVTHVTGLATEQGYTTPPVVLVDNKRIDPTAAALTAAINNAQ